MSNDLAVPWDSGYTEEEKRLIVQYVSELRKDYIVGFLQERKLLRSGTKEDLRDRIQQNLDDGHIKHAELVELLDSVTPYGKQHIYLYNGPESEITTWRDAGRVAAILEQNDLLKYLETSLRLLLPSNMSLTRINYQPEQRLTVTAVERREHFERLPSQDTKKTLNGKEIELRAFLHQITRGVVIFDWDLVSNTAQLQISQLASGTRYEDVLESFEDLTAPWLQIRLFSPIDIGRVITRLHELEEQGQPEARYHGIGYRTLGGRSVIAQSPTARVSVFGESPVDNAMRAIRGQGALGHIGNFYWLPRDVNPSHNNPLEKEVHTILIGNKKRMNLTTPNREGDIEYVLSRVRALSM